MAGDSYSADFSKKDAAKSTAISGNGDVSVSLGFEGELFNAPPYPDSLARAIFGSSLSYNEEMAILLLLAVVAYKKWGTN